MTTTDSTAVKTTTAIQVDTAYAPSGTGNPVRLQIDDAEKRHENNGSLQAFNEGFQEVAGRAPEAGMDYTNYFSWLLQYTAPSLTPEQLEKCRERGRECGRKNANHWKLVRLSVEEIEQVVRSHFKANVHFWKVCHDICAIGSTEISPDLWATARTHYLAHFFTPQQLDEIQRQVWFEELGESVWQCSCDNCLKMRNTLFPERALAWQKCRQEQWQAVETEARRQFPAIPEEHLSLILQRRIQGDKAADPSPEAVAQLVRCQARYELDPLGEFDERVQREVVDPLLAKWRGESPASQSSGPDGQAQ
jgi:hypothetical protein